MKTKYKHIHFVESGEFQTRLRYSCCNNKSGAVLADVFYYTPWHKYCVKFNPSSVFDEGCLRDIADYLSQLK